MKPSAPHLHAATTGNGVDRRKLVNESCQGKQLVSLQLMLFRRERRLETRPPAPDESTATLFSSSGGRNGMGRAKNGAALALATKKRRRRKKKVVFWNFLGHFASTRTGLAQFNDLSFAWFSSFLPGFQ
ncbi:hypothetical protein JCGZ_01504 [Jatropha curcas]|uniref:Uncharacterized protein n=1 Tax=Jatropha curcas TaxID=180498 RepID=A0A067LKX9_JATCU|nr:hypothetical protein JCGZ_01504 [Jatropha curcas]